jgi:hypothetical protein
LKPGVVTIKKAYLIVAGFFAACLSGILIYGISETARLKGEVKSLKSAIVKSQDDCETRIANIKAGKNESDIPDVSSKSLYKEKPNFGLSIGKSPAVIPHDIIQGLGLSNEQVKKASAVLRDYRRKKAKIYSGVSKGDGTFNFGSFEYLKELEKAIVDTRERIKDIFSEYQYTLMIEKEYDQMMGIALPEKPKKNNSHMTQPNSDLLNK